LAKQIVVIGAGFAGLSAACYLAQKGCNVTVLEKNEMAGGRARTFSEQGFLFDMGPSWYWMPDVFDKFFGDFGKKTSDYYDLVRLDPSYQVFFSEKEVVKIPANMQELEQLFEHYEKGSSLQLRAFLQQAEYKYQVGINKLVYYPSRSITEFIDVKLLVDMVRMNIFQSFAKHARQFFKNPQLLKLVEFPIIFLGATAESTPALYSLMNYADMSLGTWYPQGGMHKIVEGMVSLAKELGVTFRFSEAVTGFDIQGKNVKSVKTAQNTYTADAVVGAADYHHIDQQLLPEKYRNYSPEYWDKRTMAPSCLLYYVGVNKRLKNLLHHNLFFDEDFTVHAHEIYEQPKFPSKPLFYVSVPSQTDSSVAPEGHENLFLLIPTAPNLKDTPDIKAHYYHVIMDRLERLTGQSIRDAVVYKRAYAHSNFIADYNSFKGNAYGLANTLRQTAILKPTLKNNQLNNLFFAGQLTVPGPGVPPSLISGKVVADYMLK
jgi:phytoene desaturase